MYNTVTRKWYVGQSLYPRERFLQHLRGSGFDCKEMYKDAQKYGRDSFKLIVFDSNVPFCWAGRVEQAWYDACAFWNDMYNVRRPSEKGNLGKNKFKPEDFDPPTKGMSASESWREDYPRISDHFPQAKFDRGIMIRRSFFNAT